MSDTSYPTLQHYGTAAQRAAFTPSPAGGTQPIYTWYETDTDLVYIYTTAWKGPYRSNFAGSRLVQVVNTETGAVATGTTTLPYDDTIPQITEGTEFMTLAITPTSATNKLKIEIVFNFASSVVSPVTVALFQDATANALAAAAAHPGTTASPYQVVYTHYMTSGTTSATTFRVRSGPNAAGTVTFNGSASARIFGGVMASTITISEIIP